MSTRCHIILKNKREKAYVYHHFDGYPEGVGEELKKCIIDAPIKDYGPNSFAEYLTNYDSQYEFENYGIHGDEEYLYVIDFDKKSYTCFEIGLDESEEEIMQKNPVFIINIDNINKPKKFLIG